MFAGPDCVSCFLAQSRRKGNKYLVDIIHALSSIVYNTLYSTLKQSSFQHRMEISV